MTVFVLLERCGRKFWEDFVHEASVIEGVQAAPIETYTLNGNLGPEETIEHIASLLKAGDALHVKYLGSLGRTIRESSDAIRKLNSCGVRVVVSELDGAEFDESSAEKYLKIINQFLFEK